MSYTEEEGVASMPPTSLLDVGAELNGMVFNISPPHHPNVSITYRKRNMVRGQTDAYISYICDT